MYYVNKLPWEKRHLEKCVFNWIDYIIVTQKYDYYWIILFNVVNGIDFHVLLFIVADTLW